MPAKPKAKTLQIILEPDVYASLVSVALEQDRSVTQLVRHLCNKLHRHVAGLQVDDPTDAAIADVLQQET